MVGVVLLGLLLMWMYRRGKKAAAGQANQDLKQDGFEDHLVASASTIPPGLAPDHRLEAAGGGSHNDYAELQNRPAVYGELGGAQRSELHSDHVTKAELPSDAEVNRAGGRRW